MLETFIQRAIIKWAKAKGFMVIRLRATDKAGLPDLMLLKNGRTLFIEVKQKGKLPTPLQLKKHEQLRAQGFKVVVMDEVPHKAITLF